MELPTSDALHAGAPAASRNWPLVRVCAVAAAALVIGFQFLPPDLNPGLSIAAQAAGTSALLTLVAVGWAAAGRRPVIERLGLGPGRSGLFVGVMLAIGLLGLSHALDQLINVLDLRETSNLARLDRAVGGEPESSWIWMLLGLALAPGIGEEIFFRGLIQRGLGPWLGRVGALLASSAAFGAIHRDPVHSAGAFFLGVYLGLVADRTGSTRAAIGCHVFNNLAAVAGVALPPQHAVHPLVLVGAGLALAVGALALTGRWLRPERAVGEATAD